MKVYMRPVLKLLMELTEAAGQDPEHVRISHTRDGDPQTFVKLIEVEDERGRTCFLVPDSVKVTPQPTDWEISVHAVGEEEIQVRKNGQLLRPFVTTVTAKDKRMLRKYSCTSGELTIMFARSDGDLIHMQPVVMRNRRNGNFYIDPRLRHLGPAEELMVFVEERPLPDEEEKEDSGDMEVYRLYKEEQKEAPIND